MFPLPSTDVCFSPVPFAVWFISIFWNSTVFLQQYCTESIWYSILQLLVFLESRLLFLNASRRWELHCSTLNPLAVYLFRLFQFMRVEEGLEVKLLSLWNFPVHTGRNHPAPRQPLFFLLSYLNCMLKSSLLSEVIFLFSWQYSLNLCNNGSYVSPSFGSSIYIFLRSFSFPPSIRTNFAFLDRPLLLLLPGSLRSSPSNLARLLLG